VLPDMLGKIFGDSATVEQAAAEASEQMTNILNG
jgi:hypothetical protein